MPNPASISVTQPPKEKPGFFTLRKRLCLFFLCGLAIAAWLLTQRALVTLTLHSDTPGTFKIYWAGPGQAYRESRSAAVWIQPRQSRYTLLVGNLRHISRLRIDPLDRPAHLVILQIDIRQAAFQAVHLTAAAAQKTLKPLRQVKHLAFQPGRIDIALDGSDPQIEVHVRPLLSPRRWTATAVQILLAAVLLGLLMELATHVPRHFDYIPGLMCFVLALILAMAFVSRFNMHPDEYVHVQAGAYYEAHWLPPSICQPGTERSYSVHGVSRLNSFEIAYFFAGRFAALLRPLPLPDYLRLRLFNILLFGLLLWMCLTGRQRLLYLPLLVSPQVWYIFSYFNSDAFSFFICFVVGRQLIEEDSLLKRFFQNQPPPGLYLRGLAGGALLLAMLPLLKLNFYFFSLYACLYLFIKLYENRFLISGQAFKRAAVLAAVALFLLGGRYGVDVYRNGFNRQAKLTACRNKLARPKFKPDTPLKDQYFGLNLRKKGVTVKQMFDRYGWGRVSFQSTFGVYGYMALYGSKTYYGMIRGLAIAFGALLVFTALWRTDLATRLHLANSLLCALLLLAAAFWNSWNVDLQNQGRYFLPIFAMAGFLLVQMEPRIQRGLLNLLVAGMFLLSTYSFLLYGLARIPKIG